MTPALDSGRAAPSRRPTDIRSRLLHCVAMGSIISSFVFLFAFVAGLV